MQRNLISSLFILVFTFTYGQSNSIIEVKGTITSSGNDVEGITVYNTSSNKGAITNAEGEFVIKVGLNNIVEVSALQFKAVSVTITQDVLDSKLLKIYLTEHVNQLDAILLSSGLFGNLATDINNAKSPKKINMNLNWENIKDLEFLDDRAFDNSVVNHELNKLVNKGGLYNGIDFASLLGINKLLKRKKKQKKTSKVTKTKDVLDVYYKFY